MDQFFKHLFMKHLCMLKDKRFKSNVFRWCLNGIFFPFHESFRSYPKLPYQFFKHLFMKHLCTLKDKRFKSKVFRWCLNGIFFRSYPKVNSCAQQSSHIKLQQIFKSLQSFGDWTHYPLISLSIFKVGVAIKHVSICASNHMFGRTI